MESLNERKETKEKHIQHVAALSFGMICLIVGIPLWWRTTEVYRVSLPYSDIQHLSDSKIEYVAEIEVVLAADQKYGSVFLSDLALTLKRQLERKKVVTESLIPKYQIAVREAQKSELDALKMETKESALDHIFPCDKLNKYQVFIVDSSPLFSQPILVPSNTIFLPFNGAAVEAVSAQVSQLVRDVVRESAVRKSLETAQGLKIQRPDKDTMRSFRYHSGYDVTFTLMIPEPEHGLVEWDIERGIEDYLQPLVSSLEEYTNIALTSQVLYFISIGGRPKKGNGFLYFQEQDLPHVINPLETKLGSHASNNPGINFVVYIPTRNTSPLYIQDKNGQRIESNAFFSPRWGGVMIYNRDTTKNVSSPDISVDMHEIMKVFITQLRLLLNIDPQIITKELKVVNTGTSQLQQWELAGWLRYRCVENLATATATLQSLAQLLEEISNIVINDQIGKEVESAVASIKECHTLLSSGQLEEAFLASRAAVEASEQAFFNPSLLELLYFPEDQKFAIYIPLFLPISIPIMTSMFQAIKWFRQRRKLKSE